MSQIHVAMLTIYCSFELLDPCWLEGVEKVDINLHMAAYYGS